MEQADWQDVALLFKHQTNVKMEEAMGARVL